MRQQPTASWNKADREVILGHLLDAARGASDRVMRVYASADVDIEMKGPNDPVTRADKEANAFILAHLEQALPGIPIVAEESDPATFEGFRSAPAALFVDPVDGTRDFIAKNGEFCVMIGLAVAGRATIGVVVCPAYEGRRRTYAAAEGLGAYCFDEHEARTQIQVTQLVDLARARCAVSRFRRTATLNARLAALGCREVISIGSSGIKGVQVATGGCDLYVHPSSSSVKLWDACAPEAIVRAAGGSYTDTRGKPFDYQGPVSQGRGTVAGNPTLHTEVIRRLALDQAKFGATRGDLELPE